MTKTVDLYVSSVTGNTRKLAERLTLTLESQGIRVRIKNTGPETCQEAAGFAGDGKPGQIREADIPVILCFWCRKTGLDDLSLKLAKTLTGRRICAFGTMGSYPDSPYGDQVRENVFQAISENNQCLGVWLCRGRIDEKRTEKRRNLPKDHRHYLNDEGYERHLSSRTHPDARDLDRGEAFLRKIIKEQF